MAAPAGTQLAAMLAMAAAIPANGEVLSSTTLASVGAANALSTPAARHLVRMDSGTYLIAVQRDGASSGGLDLFRSDDDAQTWSFYASINPRPSERQTADALKVGDDLAVVASFDASSILPDPLLDPGRKVYFQWWRSDRAGNWLPEQPVTVFDPEPGAAYHRGELAIDALGRIWIQAFKRGAAACDPAKDPKCARCDVVANGDNFQNEIVLSMSADGGRTFAPAQSLGTTLCRAGGRLIAAGTKLLMLWNDYSANENGTRIVTRFVERDAADPVAFWSAPQDAFPDEPADGIYHGAAMSAVADASGVHLVYKDQNRMRLWYRRFDAVTGTFGPRIQVDDSADDWALQPATALRNGELFILANHRLSEGSYQTRMWALSTGLGADSATAIGSDDAFHAYPTLPEKLPGTAGSLPYVYARAPTAVAAADEVTLRIALDRPAASLSLDRNVVLPAGKTIAVRVQTLKIAGIGAPIALDLGGLPAGVHAAFDPSLVLPGGTSTLTLSADADAATISAPCTLGMTAGVARATLSFELDVKGAPQVTLHGPPPGTALSGRVQVEVIGAASPGLALAEVRLTVDGAEVATSTTSPAAFALDTTALANGAHDLGAVALDEIGNSARSAPLRVEVRNKGGGGGGCASAAGEPLLALAAALVACARRFRLSSRCRAG